jgi:hypothetical protein
MAKTIGRWALIVAVVCVSSMGAIARADISDSRATNLQDGRNTSTSNQSGKGKTGSAVGGQVAGVVSSGRASVDAKNTSKDSSVTSGDARGSNSASGFTGLNSSEGGPTLADISGARAENLQDGSNRSTYSQTASYATGDGVAGQIVGVVTARGGTTSIVAANETSGSDVTTGDATGTNDVAAFTGLNTSGGGPDLTADITGSCGTGCANVQNGSSRITSSQTSNATSGDGVAGQVIGAVSGGATSVDAKNTTTDTTVDTGNATGDNSASLFAGLNDSGGGPTLSDITGSCNGSDACDNVQDGNNRVSSSQSSWSKSGDGVGGEVIGVVTSAGGSASVVAANTTKNTDITTGKADSTNDLSAFVGLNSSESGPLLTSDISTSCTASESCDNVQNGDNRLTGSQTAHSATGDGVGGQVLGVVSAGAASVDATNTSDGGSVSTGDSHATNAASSYVGLNTSGGGPTITAVDVTGARATNLQDGTNNKTITQSADATSGDGVAGQVSGVVTSAGGSASVVLANTSTNIDSSSGDSHFDNSDSSFVGLNASGTLSVG